MLAVQTKGVGWAFHAFKKLAMARCNSGTLRKTPRRTAFCST